MASARRRTGTDRARGHKGLSAGAVRISVLSAGAARISVLSGRASRPPGRAGSVILFRESVIPGRAALIGRAGAAAGPPGLLPVFPGLLPLPRLPAQVLLKCLLLPAGLLRRRLVGRRLPAVELRPEELQDPLLFLQIQLSSQDLPLHRTDLFFINRAESRTDAAGQVVPEGGKTRDLRAEPVDFRGQPFKFGYSGNDLVLCSRIHVPLLSDAREMPRKPPAGLTSRSRPRGALRVSSPPPRPPRAPRRNKRPCRPSRHPFPRKRTARPGSRTRPSCRSFRSI